MCSKNLEEGLQKRDKKKYNYITFLAMTDRLGTLPKAILQHFSSFKGAANLFTWEK